MPPLASSLTARAPGSNLIASNATEAGLQVVCAWPLSGQYGPGTRVLYYVLVAACVFARKEEWLRNACLAGALLFPAIAAVHGIVLAAVHVDGAIDMDVYGAFQLCSIGILTAPATARMSGTYFKDPRRHIIFLWTGLILAGLLSLTVEFFRIKPSTCTQDDYGNPISSVISSFAYNTTCGLRCSTDEGPFSPIRVGSTNEIYVIPAPNKLTFGTVSLLAAACCIPAILSLLWFWSLILQENWDKTFRRGTEEHQPDSPIIGTNGATPGMMLHINALVRTVLSTVEVPVFAAAVLAILTLGERNFFSDPVDYQTEPIASIGQWAPIVGAGFAVIGSLYFFLTGDDTVPASRPCLCRCHSLHVEPDRAASSQPRNSASNEAGSTTDTAPTPRSISDVGSRRSIARVLIRLSNFLTIKAHDRLLGDAEFKLGRAGGYPTVPAEEGRNPALSKTQEFYNPERDADGKIILSRLGSNMSMGSWREGQGSSTNSRGISPRSLAQSTRSRSRSRSPSPLPSPSRARLDRNSTVLTDLSVSSRVESPADRQRTRRDTLEVPSHHGAVRHSSSISSMSSMSSSGFTIQGGQISPTIVVSSDGDPSPLPRTPGIQVSASPAEPPASYPPSALRHGRRFTS